MLDRCFVLGNDVLRCMFDIFFLLEIGGTFGSENVFVEVMVLQLVICVG